MSRQSLMFGYVESWEGLSLTQAAQAGYTGIILAFGSIDGTAVGVYEDSFPPDNGSDGKVDMSLLKGDIDGALQAGAKQVLISFGGANNTYNPGSATASDLAQAIVAFVQSAGFTGCDFDIEIETDGEFLSDLLQAIRNQDSELILTAAPQLNNVNGVVQFVSTGTSTDYDCAIQAGLFDYLLPQAYCTGGFTIMGQTEADVGFISAALPYIVDNLIPDGTLVAIGEPADEQAAACGVSIFASNPPSYNAIAEQYQAVAENAGFGGAMVWSVNADEANNYAFVNAVGPVIQGSA